MTVQACRCSLATAGRHLSAPSGFNAGTSNAVNDAFAAEGEPDAYTNITVAHELACPNLGYLTTASNLPEGTGKSEYYEALVVAMDMLVKAVEARQLSKMAKRLIVMSDFEAQVGNKQAIIPQGMHGPL